VGSLVSLAVEFVRERDCEPEAEESFLGLVDDDFLGDLEALVNFSV